MHRILNRGRGQLACIQTKKSINLFLIRKARGIARINMTGMLFDYVHALY